ncbi:hypothetical protein NQZ68_020861 [Dissostichus eleginoides]|nr:hypothetical protein NQZ68_020861 [Dissostichus eleginoides]
MFFRPVFAMIRPFLPDKIRKRIHMHGADFQDTLSDFFSPSVLPPEYGGEGPGIVGCVRPGPMSCFNQRSFCSRLPPTQQGLEANYLSVFKYRVGAKELFPHHTVSSSPSMWRRLRPSCEDLPAVSRSSLQDAGSWQPFK